MEGLETDSTLSKAGPAQQSLFERLCQMRPRTEPKCGEHKNWADQGTRPVIKLPHDAGTDHKPVPEKESPPSSLGQSTPIVTNVDDMLARLALVAKNLENKGHSIGGWRYIRICLSQPKVGEVPVGMALVETRLRLFWLNLVEESEKEEDYKESQSTAGIETMLARLMGSGYRRTARQHLELMLRVLNHAHQVRRTNLFYIDRARGFEASLRRAEQEIALLQQIKQDYRHQTETLIRVMATLNQHDRLKSERSELKEGYSKLTERVNSLEERWVGHDDRLIDLTDRLDSKCEEESLSDFSVDYPTRRGSATSTDDSEHDLLGAL
jgi:hypothetical protein